LLESFHPQRSSHPADKTKLTWRKASHSIAAAIITKKTDLKKKKKKKKKKIRNQRKGLRVSRPLRAPLYSLDGVL
jgi:hypothetical protein